LFDETGSREVAEFVQFMERHTVREAEAAEALRVMTIHKSKGLGFDVVLLPDLEGIRLDCRREGLAVQKAGDRSVEWVLDLPVRLFHAQDEVLAAHVRGAEADACYENLSLLYVAMTRAKRATYLIAKPPGRSTSRNFTKLLAETLGEESQPVRIGRRELAGAYAEGDPDWHARVVLPQPEPARKTGLPKVEAAHVSRSPRLPARKPSAMGGLELSGTQLFSLAAGGAADFGTDVHRLLAEIEWAGEAPPAEVRETWLARGVSAEVARAASECLAAPALAHVWRRRARTEVWRERAFEVVLDGTWLTGVFDRVLVERDAEGTATRALIVDFKTDKVGTGEADLQRAAGRHAPQLELYRRVVSVLAGLALEAVDCAVVFTQVRRAVAIPRSEAPPARR
jgi:ATP-dependent exoDNAse (exonuclease V) beta subunit